MKKLTLIILSLLLALSLAACGGNAPAKEAENTDSTPLTREDSTPLTREDNEAPMEKTEDTQAPSAEDADIESVIKDANRNSMTPEQIADLEADAAQNGYEIEWQEDGSLVIVEDGNGMSLNNDWPDNEYTKGVPAPDFGITMSSEDETGLTIIFGDVTKDDVAAYAEKLKSAGFTENAETSDQEVAGMSMYLYSAYHADGRLAELTFTGMQSALIISK